MKKLLLFVMMFVLLTSLTSYSQTSIHYYYDASGNRTERVIDLGSKGSGNVENDKNNTKEPLETAKELEEVIKDDTFSPQSLRIYPNPTKGLIRLEIPEDSENDDEIIIIVQDLNGRMIMNKPNKALMTEIDLSGQPDGIYILQLKKGMKISKWKIIKQ